MRRLFSVIWRCVLLVFPFCAALAYRDLKKRGATKWDRKGNYVVTYSQISGQRWLAAVSLMFIFTVSSFVGMWELLATERGQPHDPFTGNVQPEGKTDDIRTKANAAADAGLQKVLTRTLSDTKTEAKEYFGKGVAYDLQGDAASALFGYQKAVELDPEFQQAWYAIGVWHLKLKQNEEAIEALKKASALAPKDAGTWYQLASAYAARGYPNDTNFALHRLEQLNQESATGLVQSFNVEFVQKLATAAYPDLAAKDSPLNRGFVARYNAYKEQKATLMEHSDWPIRLAKEAVAELNSISQVNAAYPETLVGGSPLSIAINAERDRLRQDNPSYFNDPRWPERLADFCAEQIGVKRSGMPGATGMRDSGVASRQVSIPASGTILFDAYPDSHGPAKLTVSNGTQSNAVAKLIDSRTDKKTLSFVIGAGQEETIEGIPDGDYRCIFALGDKLYAGTDRFQSPRAFSKFDRPFSFITNKTNTGIQYTTLSVTLTPVVGGNVTTTSISQEEFNRY